MSRIWFITGTSRGLGREWALAALRRGDRVAAAARGDGARDLADEFGDLVLPLDLDVRDRDEVFAAVAYAHERFTRLDVIVNNAGYGLFGMVEEATEPQIRDQIETNLFGTLWVTQAALPILRAQGGGHILNVSSIGGVTAFPTLGIYHASKWAVEGFSQAMAMEVAPFGVHVTLIEPAGYATDWRGSSSVNTTPLPDYERVRSEVAAPIFAALPPRGVPGATGDVILEIVDMAEPPLRAFLGSGPLEIVRRDYEARLRSWDSLQPLAVRAQGLPSPDGAGT